MVTRMLAQLVHWFFSQEYFKVALYFPLLAETSEKELKRKGERVWWILLFANIGFFCLVVLWIVVSLWMSATGRNQ